MREREMDAARSERAREEPLVSRSGVAVQQAHRHRLGAVPQHRLHQAYDGAALERPLDPAVGEHPLRDAEPPRARHQGRRPARLEGVERGPYLPADLDDVLETRRRHEDDARSAPLEQRVGRNRGPVVQGGGPRGERQGSEAVADRARGVVGRRAELRHPYAAADEHHEIGEGASRVDPDHGEALGARPSQELVFAGVPPDSVLVVPFDSAPESEPPLEPAASGASFFFSRPLPDPARA